MRLSILAVLATVGLALGACATVPLSEPVANIDSIQKITASGISPIKVGVFAPGPQLAPAKDRSVNSRAATIKPPGGSFAGYLGQTVAAELKAAGKLDAASGLEVSGFLVESELHSASTVTGDAALAARFILKRDGVVVYDKVLRDSDVWKSAFIGAEAIPDAINHYYGLYGGLARMLLQDPEFIAAAKG